MVNSIQAQVAGYQSPSLFNVIDPSGKTIAENQPYYSAFSVSKVNPKSRIKFCRMIGKGGAS